MFFEPTRDLHSTQSWLFHIWSIVIAWVANLALQKSNKFPISLRRFRRVPDRFLEKWDYNGKAKTFSDRFNGHSIFVSDDNLDPKDGLLFGSMWANS
jgi:hypothetical protein